MSYTRRLWLTFWPAALAVGALTALLVLESNHDDRRVLTAVLGPLVGWSFIAAGLVAWSRRPANNTGRLMVALGFAWALTALTEANDKWIYSTGLAVEAIFLAVFIHLVVSFPTGRLSSRFERTIVYGAYGVAVFSNVLSLLVDSTPIPDCKNCPSNVFLVTRSDTAATAIQIAADLCGIVLAGAVVTLLVRRWRSATPAGRRVLSPIYLSGGATMILLAIAFAVDPWAGGFAGVLKLLASLAFVSVPYFFLAGLMRARLARAGVGRLFVDVPENPSPEELHAAFRRALHDPTVRLAHWLPERRLYVDLEGWPFDEVEAGRTLTPVEYEGRRVGALIHDPSLLEEPELLEAAVASARIGLEKDRLQAELRARLIELEREQDFVRTVVDNAPALFCVVDTDGRVMRFNATLSRMSGAPDDDSRRGEPFAKLFLPPEDAASFRVALAAADGEEFESEWLGADGGRRIVAWSVMPIVDAQGRPRRLISGVDVTERRRQEARTRALLDAMPDLMFRMTRDGVFVDYHAHDEAELVSTDAIGRSVYDRLPRPVAEQALAAARRALDEGGVQTHEYSLELRGFERHYEARVVASAADEVVSIVREITDRKEQEQEVRKSRARIVQAADAERRRLERNLHDGAQQRLVSLSLALRLAEARIETHPDSAKKILAEAQQELAQALAELRELARGIHPAILTDRGLAAAVEALAARAPLPVEVAAMPDERLPDPVEAAAYYVVAEGLTNVAKYADASFVRVTVERRNGIASVEVADDGIGGADPLAGTGLRGLADRIEALGGRLEVDSPASGGTRLRAHMPVG